MLLSFHASARNKKDKNCTMKSEIENGIIIGKDAKTMR